MEWLMFAVTVPVLPLFAIFGAWIMVRPAPPARGTVGLACDDSRSTRA